MPSTTAILPRRQPITAQNRWTSHNQRSFMSTSLLFLYHSGHFAVGTCMPLMTSRWMSAPLTLHSCFCSTVICIAQFTLHYAYLISCFNLLNRFQVDFVLNYKIHLLGSAYFLLKFNSWISKVSSCT